jgi:5-methylcytosine-specific restriction endonuclease McrA
MGSHRGIKNSHEKRMKLWDKQHGLCAICSGLINWNEIHTSTFDCIIPIAKGGNTSIDNLQLAHERCNKVKGNRIL